VSTRAVFRHFDNMETLFEASAELQIERVMRDLPSVLTEGPRNARIESLVAHSAQRNERVAPVRRAALLCEPFSKLIRERHGWMRGEARRQIRTVFRPELDGLTESQRRDRVAALRTLLSFSTWDELRRHDRLAVSAAERVLRDAVAGLLDR